MVKHSNQSHPASHSKWVLLLFKGASHIGIYYEKRHWDVSLKNLHSPGETSHLFIDIYLAPNKRPYWVNTPLLHRLEYEALSMASKNLMNG